MAGSTQARDLTRLPVAGMEGRTMEVFINPSRGDFDRLPYTRTSTDYGDDADEAVSAGVVCSRSR